MINRIAAGVDAPGNGYRRPAPLLIVPDRTERRSPWADLGERVEKYIGDHPVASLAIGLTVGIVIGCLVKRR